MSTIDFDQATQKLINEFGNDYLIATKGRKPNTVRAYTSAVKAYGAYLQEHHLGLEHLTVDECLFRSFLAHLRQRKHTSHHDKELADSTISRYLSAVHAFWKFLYRKGLASPVLSRELMDIEISYDRNPTIPVVEFMQN